MALFTNLFISRRRLFLISGVAMLGFMLLMRLLTEPLTPGEILSFEMAKETAVASHLMAEWSADPEGKMDKAVLSVLLDFVFIIFYTLFFYLGARFMGGLSGNPVMEKAGRFFSWLVVAASFCDVIENICMLRTLSGEGEPISWVVHLTYDMAIIKFSLLMIAAFFMVIGFLVWLVKSPGSE